MYQKGAYQGSICRRSFLRLHFCVYTDGSVYDKEVGCGVSSAVTYHTNPNTEISYKSTAVGRMVSWEEWSALTNVKLMGLFSVLT